MIADFFSLTFERLDAVLQTLLDVITKDKRWQEAQPNFNIQELLVGELNLVLFK